MKRTHSTTTNGTTRTAPAAAGSPFGPVIKRQPKPKPGIPAPRRPADHTGDDGPAIPKIPGPRQPSITPLLLAGRTRPTATVTDLLRAHLNRVDLEWGLHLAHTAISDSEQARAA